MNFHQPDPPARFQPFDTETEQSVLATLLAYPDAIAIAAAHLTPEDFADPLHQRIFDVMLVLEEMGKTIAPVTMHARMKNDPGILILKEQRQEVSFEAEDYFRVLAQSDLVMNPHTLPELAGILVAHRERRDAYDALWEAQQRLDKGDRLDTSLAAIIEVSDATTLREVQSSASSDLGDHFERGNREAEKVKVAGLVLDLPPFDEAFGGFQPESLTVVAGRPGMGKSILGTTILHAAARQKDADGNPVWLPMGFSLEMSGYENACRIIAEMDFEECLRLGRTDPMQYSEIRKRRLSDDQWTRYVLLGQTLRELGIQVFDEAKMTMQKIRALARARQMLAGGKRKVVTVIDHLQIVGASKTYRGNRIEELTEITGLCKGLAKQLKAPVIALSQLSRGVDAREDKRPVLSDLRESGSIEQDADAVLFMYRAEYYLRAALRHAQNSAGKGEMAAKLQIQADASANVLDLDIAKNRHGRVTDVKLWIDVSRSIIRAVKPGDEPPPQAELGFGAEPLDGLSDLAKRTGAA
jgi:replicative DNA helicase